MLARIRLEDNCLDLTGSTSACRKNISKILFFFYFTRIIASILCCFSYSSGSLANEYFSPVSRIEQIESLHKFQCRPQGLSWTKWFLRTSTIHKVLPRSFYGVSKKETFQRGDFFFSETRKKIFPKFLKENNVKDCPSWKKSKREELLKKKCGGKKDFRREKIFSREKRPQEGLTMEKRSYAFFRKENVFQMPF